ncbi:MAG: M48 family metallopeptidase [bacterium]|nr:M48 family metallopeptidase [bacterium]
MSKEKLIVLDRNTSYRVRTHPRAKHVRITIRPGGDVVVTKPRRVPLWAVRRFVAAKRDWIARGRARRQATPVPELLEQSREHYLAHREAARRLLATRADYWATRLGHRYRRLSVRRVTSRWGSCSRGGTLSFNYKLLFLPERLVDYVVVHELCHLRELNHSSRFWALVRGALPDYESLRSELRNL